MTNQQIAEEAAKKCIKHTATIQNDWVFKQMTSEILQAIERTDKQLSVQRDIRDLFAAAALQGMLAYPGDNQGGSAHNNSTPERNAQAAYDYADAMLDERRQREWHPLNLSEVV